MKSVINFTLIPWVLDLTVNLNERLYPEQAQWGHYLSLSRRIIGRMTKICTECLLPKSLSAFSKDKAGRDGHQSTCKQCQAARRSVLVEFLCPLCHLPYFVTEGAARSKRKRVKDGGLITCRACASEANATRGRYRTGSNNPNWKGGVTSEADKFYNSTKWKELRTQAFIRDRYTCQDCGQVGRKLEANHIKPRSKHPELKLVLSNIETLCKKCHDAKKWMVYAN